MSDAAKRKQRQRDREKEKALISITFKVTKEHASRIDEACTARGYDRGEYFSLLSHRDWEKVNATLESLGDCEYCGENLPQGCNGKFKGLGQCFKTVKQRELLSL